MMIHFGALSLEKAEGLEILGGMQNTRSWPLRKEFYNGSAIKFLKLGSVAGPVIQANGRLTFEDDLRSGGLLYFTTQ